MKTRLVGAVAALAMVAGSVAAVAHEGPNHGRQGTGSPGAQAPQNAQPGGHGQRMAEMHARMAGRHGAAHGGGHQHGHGHDHGQPAAPVPAPSPAK